MKELSPRYRKEGNNDTSFGRESNSHLVNIDELDIFLKVTILVHRLQLQLHHPVAIIENDALRIMFTRPGPTT